MLGYRQDREDWDYLRANAKAFPANCCATGEIPDDFHPQLRTKNQKQTNSCVGHGRSTMFAHLNWLITGEEVDYSAWYAYLTAQRACNMFGVDEGATLAGAMASGGCCREDTLRFPGYYTTSMPAAAVTEAKEHPILQFSELRGYDAIWRYTSTHQGPVLIGTEWYEGHARLGKDGLESKASCLRGSSLGYHCRCIIGWSSRRDSLGRRWLRCKNSHSTEWGNQGESEIEPALVDEWANDRFSAFFGASELRPFEPRPVNWLDHQWIPV
ncbi:C1 family peptidase [Schlesneria paludicola]|uniref:peptidase C1 n=1 Tax=Schlesneria paludicola TaxID=360056 RepID=UPI00029A9876|nr:peptidase C1 [Schlesneria paludicola]